MIGRENFTIRFAVPLFFGITMAGVLALHGCRATGHSERISNRIGAETVEPTPRSAPGTASPGRWGGEGVRMEVTPAAARLEWDCAHGSIEKPFAPDEKGRFAVEGLYVRERSGPLRVGEQPPALRASYSGSVAGETMTLRVTLIESNESIGTFSLTRGQRGRLRKCR